MFSILTVPKKVDPIYACIYIYICVCRLAMFHDSNPSPVLEGLRSQILLCGGCEGAPTGNLTLKMMILTVKMVISHSYVSLPEGKGTF